MKSKSVACAVILWFCWLPTAMGMIFGTYNIRYDTTGDHVAGDSWPQRLPVVAELIRFHDFDVIGTQEGLPAQMDDLSRLLPEYSCSSHGRDDGERAGEHMGIFFKTAKYELVDSGSFWISETPDQPGIGWDAALNRICGWAKLRVKESGKTFYYFCLHMDHRGSKSRHEGAALVLRKIDEIAKDGDPVILVGDFNTDQNSETYRLLAASPRLADACGLAKSPYTLNGTANGFDPNYHTDSRIDHIFITKGLNVRRFGVLTDSYRATKPEKPASDEETSGNFPSEVKFKQSEARLPSDHFPVLVEITDW